METISLPGFFPTSHNKSGKYSSIVVSYAIYCPPKSDKVEHQQCLSNTDYFLHSIVPGLEQDEGVTFAFTLIDDTEAPQMLLGLSRRYSNSILVGRIRKVPVDLIVHQKIIDLKHFQNKTHFILLNCGARGPYSAMERNPLSWIDKFIDRIRGKVKAVGATISCEISPHIQTYALAINRDAAKVLTELWGGKFKGKDKLALITGMEVHGSTVLLQHGYEIAALDSRYNNESFCASMKQKYKYGENLNPTTCLKTGQSMGCEPVNPCEVVFVKYGGEVLWRGHISPVIIKWMGDFEGNRGVRCE